MKCCEKCVWLVSYFRCQKKRDEDGDPIRTEPNAVCDSYEPRRCEACISYDDGYCNSRINSLGNCIRVGASGVCDGYFRNPEWGNKYRASGSSDCFLTSACVDYYGKPDDCYELTTLRKLRDEYLLNINGGKALVEQYYKIAPNIVEKINISNNRDEYYEKIYEEIQKCVELYEANEFSKSVIIYKEMVNYFMEEFDDV